MEIEKSDVKAIRERHQPRGVLTERDAKACLWVLEQGAMTVDQLWRAVWWSDASRGPRYAYERVLFLERAGFLVRIATPYSQKNYFRATRMAQELVSGRSEGYGPLPLSSPPLNEIPHADLLTEIRLLIARSGRHAASETWWRPDRVLSVDPGFPRERFYGILPDAIWVTRRGKRIAVEYERTRKGITRVRPKVEALSREIARTDRAIDFVLWVATPAARVDLAVVLPAHPAQRLRSFEELKSELAGQVDEDTKAGEGHHVRSV